MTKKRFFLTCLSLLLTTSVVFAWNSQHEFYLPILLQPHYVEPIGPGIIPFSLNDPLPCDIEAYQTRDDVEIIVNDVTMPGFYQVSVFDHHLDRVYNARVLFYDGATAFISTDDWPGDTYYLQIIVPGGWLEGEFEIDW